MPRVRPRALGVGLALACGLGITLAAAGCGDSPLAPPRLLGQLTPIGDSGVEVRIQDRGILDRDAFTMWYDQYSITAPDLGPEDDQGVPLVEVNGQLYYHPVKIAQRGLRFLWTFGQTGDSTYLDYAYRFADQLRAMADISSGGARFYPYPFDFDLHHRSSERMKAPWYSGMAQGQALSFFVRLYRLTGDSSYRQAADSTFATFLAPKTPAGHPDRFVAHVDSTGYYWVDEFPMVRQNNDTLNGFIFGVFGLYEYWRLTGDPRARQLVLASLTTLRAYLPAFRVAGEPSYYCLRHRVQDPKYHEVHVQELHQLALMSGDVYFQEMSDLFHRDHG
jgi:hypothetical protein